MGPGNGRLRSRGLPPPGRAEEPLLEPVHGQEEHRRDAEGEHRREREPAHDGEAQGPPASAPAPKPGAMGSVPISAAMVVIMTGRTYGSVMTVTVLSLPLLAT